MSSPNPLFLFRSPKLLLILATAGTGALATAWGVPAWNAGETADDSAFVTDVASRRSLRIAVTERGQLDSLQNVTLTSQVEGTTTIISIIPEGTLVQAPTVAAVGGEIVEISQSSPAGIEVVVKPEDGKPYPHIAEINEYTELLVKVGDTVEAGQPLAADLLCELDAFEIDEKYKKQQIDVTESAANLEKRREEVAIQEKQNESDIAAAKLATELAQLDLEKFVEGDSVQQENEIRGEMTVAEEELSRAREIFEFTKRQARKGYKSLNDLESDRIAVTKAEIAVAVGRDKLKVLADYSYKRELQELKATALESVRELERVERKAASLITGFKADFEAAQLRYDVEIQQLERYRRQLAACRIHAPQDGEVVYASQASRRSEPIVIEEGATVRERQRIVNLPDLSAMKVDAQIHESMINLVGVGLPANVRIDAYPDRIFEGVVRTVASVPSQSDWLRPDLKQYAAEVELVDSSDLDLKPGLTAEIEIIVNERTDVLQVPMQSVVSVGPQRYAFVMTDDGPSRRRVRVGDTNDTAVEILDGVAEGERVILNPRTHFDEELRELEAAIAEQRRGKPGGKGTRPGKPAGRPTTPKSAGKDAAKNPGEGKRRPAAS